MRIGTVVRTLRTTAHTVRFYERLPSTPRAAHGYRDYAAA
jgi:DNA-binding transcriptional MerR regulator